MRRISYLRNSPLIYKNCHTPCSLIHGHDNNTEEDRMNRDTLSGQWTQLKGSVREKWGKLTNDDIDQIQGKAEQLVGKIQERYGIARDEAQRQLDSWTPSTRP